MTIKTHGRMFTDNTVGITQLSVADGSDGQALVTDGSGTLRFATVGAGGAVGSSTYVEDMRTGNGVLTTFTLSTAAPYEESLMVFIDGVAQPTSAYTLPSTTSITLSEAPATGTSIRIVHLGIASSVGNNSITGAKIAMGGDVAGDVLYYNGTDYQRLGIGTAGQHLATNSGATAPEWAAAPSSSVAVQVVYDNTANRYSVNQMPTNATIPNDDTLPLVTEGTQSMTVNITPLSSSNILKVEHTGLYTHTVAYTGIVALFAANTCVAAGNMDYQNTTSRNTAIGTTTLTAAFTPSEAGWTNGVLTIQARAGSPESTARVTFNGSGSVRHLGTAPKSSLIVTEYTP